MWDRNSKISIAVVMVVVISGTLIPGAAGGAAPPVVAMGALAHAATSLEEATGGKILEVRLANQSGAPVFEAAVLKDGSVLYFRIASPDERVTEIDVRKLPSWLVNYRLEDYARSATKAEVPLDEAISKAEARKHAPAVDAGIARPLSGTNAVLAYFVETIDGSRREELAVDARTGVFIENPDSLLEPRTPIELARRLAPGTG